MYTSIVKHGHVPACVCFLSSFTIDGHMSLQTVPEFGSCRCAVMKLYNSLHNKLHLCICNVLDVDAAYSDICINIITS